MEMNTAFKFSDYLELQEVRVILNTVSKVSMHPERDHLLINILWQTGARITEAISLKRKDIGIAVITLRNLKQYKKVKGVRVLDPTADKDVEVSSKLCDDIKDFCSKNDFVGSDFIFRANRTNGQMKRWYPLWLLQKCSVVSGISKRGKMTKFGRKRGVYPHLFRHSNAMYLLEVTHDITIVKEQLGHADIRTSQGYAYSKKPRIKKAVAEMKWE